MLELPKRFERLPAARRVAHRLGLGVVVIAGAGLLLEAALRAVFGYGPLPRLIPDPSIEYLHAPSQASQRFGRRYRINQWSMRSPDIEPRKTAPDECRVLVIGDSIVFGADVDQEQLATAQAQRLLHDMVRRPVVVLNVSAASWGPPNQFAYVQKFGAFDADAAVIVLSSHDYSDSPHGANSRPSPPYFAVRELQREILARLVGPNVTPTIDADDADIRTATLAFRDLLMALRAHRASPIVLFHAPRAELGAAPAEGKLVLSAIAAQLDAPVSDLEPALRAALESGRSPYTDDVHLNADGHGLLSAAIASAVLQSGLCSGNVTE